MKSRISILPFFLVESLLLLAVVVPMAHVRSFGERLLLTEYRAPVAPDEGWYILVRSLLLVVALQAAFALRDLYRWNVIVRPQLVVVRLIEAVIVMLVGLPLLHYVMGLADRTFELDSVLLRLQIHPFLVLACAGAGFLGAYGLRMRWPHWVRRSPLAERLLLVGGSAAIDVVREEIRRRHVPGLELVGLLATTPGPPDRHDVLGTPDDIDQIVRDHGVQRIVLDHGVHLPSNTLLALRLTGVRIGDVSSFYEQLTGRVSLESLSSDDLFISSAGLAPAAQAFKRSLDILAAAAGLLLAFPLGLFTALLIKLDSRGPVLYSQERVGADGEVFTIHKFRSMRTDAERGSGPVWASSDDDRITRVGRWLRKLRVDEIPQLWAVIRNDMSLVGPRPERPFFVSELERSIPHYGQRHIVKPGITGWAQINHSYGNTPDDAFLKLQYDLYYIKNRSFALDIAILLRTVKVVVLQQGAV